MLYLHIIFFAILVYPLGASPTYLTGELNGDLSGRDYIVTGNIYVLPHDTLSIEPGSRIRFEPFTAIVVRGTFLCKGTARQPVLLTSVRDSLSAKAPRAFDWNGVEVTPEAGKVVVGHTRIEFSTYGVNIKSSYTPVVLRKVVFHENGYASLTRDNNLVRVEDGAPVSYSWNLGESERAALREGEREEKESVHDTLTVRRRPGKSEDVRPLKALALCSGTVGLVAGGISLVYWGEYKDAWNEADKATSADDIAAANDREKEALLGAGVLSGAAALLVPAAFVMYLVDRAKQDAPKGGTLYPVVGLRCTRVVIQYEF